MDQPDTPDQESSVSAAIEPEDGGEGIRPHVAGGSCWCCPEEVGPGLWLHHLPLLGRIRPHVAEPWCWCDPVEVEPGLWLHRDMGYLRH